MTTSCVASYMNARAHAPTANDGSLTDCSDNATHCPPVQTTPSSLRQSAKTFFSPWFQCSVITLSFFILPPSTLTHHHPLQHPLRTPFSLSPTPPSLSLSLLHSHTLRFTYQCLAFGFSNFPSIQQHSSSLSTHPLTHPGKPHPYFTRVLLRIPSVVNCVSAYLSQRERTRESM